MSTAGYSPQQRGSGPYFLHIENLPRKYTWQDLKDLIRKVAAHGLWTDMAVLPNGQPGDKGYARVQRTNEAYKLYTYLTENYIENRSLRVHLWDTSDIPAVFVRCNCGDKPHPPSNRIAQMATAPGCQTFNATSPMQMAQPSPYPPSPAATMSPQMSMPLAVQAKESQIIAAMSRMQLNPADPSHRAQFASIVNSRFTQQQQPAQPSGRTPQQYAAAPPQAPAYPMYITNTTGTPVNTTHGLIKTEARGIFISNLNFKSRERDIESFFTKAGPIVKVELQKDAAGKSKGNATVLYGSAESARNAVSMFHRREFMRMTLNVRADRERTAINAPSSSSSRDASNAQAGAKRRDEVTIVNGSQVQAPRKDSAVSGLPLKG